MPRHVGGKSFFPSIGRDIAEESTCKRRFRIFGVTRNDPRLRAEVRSLQSVHVFVRVSQRSINFLIELEVGAPFAVAFTQRSNRFLRYANLKVLQRRRIGKRLHLNGRRSGRQEDTDKFSQFERRCPINLTHFTEARKKYEATLRKSDLRSSNHPENHVALNYAKLRSRNVSST